MAIVEIGPEPVPLQPLLQYSKNKLRLRCAVVDVDESAVDASSDTMRFIVHDPRTSGTESTVIVANASISKTYEESTGITVVDIAGSSVGTLTQEVRNHSEYLLWNDSRDIPMGKGSFPVTKNYNVDE